MQASYGCGGEQNFMDYCSPAVTDLALRAEVELDVTRGGRLVAVITRESAESLGLARGMSAKAVVKATSVMVER